MEIVLRKRPLKNKVQLFNFGKRMEPSAKSSQAFAKVIKLMQRFSNICNEYRKTITKRKKHRYKV